MPQYTITVENLDPHCLGDKYNQVIVANTCIEYIVRIENSSTTKGPFNISVDGLLTYSNVSRNELINGLFLNLNCATLPVYILYASTFNFDSRTDTVYFETPLNNRWGAANGLTPEYTNTGWQNFITRRIDNDDRIVNIAETLGITNPINVGSQLRLTYPSGSGNTSALLIYPSKYGYISDSGLREIGNPTNIQGMKPGVSNKQEIILNGENYYITQISNNQGSPGQVINWQVIATED